MRAASVCILALLGTSAAAADERTPPRPHVDPDAMREARGEVPVASARAIGHYLAARRCEEHGDWRCAAAELDLAATYDDRSPELRIALSEVLALSGQLPRAEAEARRAVELAGDQGPAAARAHVLLAQYQSGRDREQAALELRLAVHAVVAAAEEGERPDPEPWRLLALLYVEMGDEDAAVRALDDLAARAPGESAAFRDVGRRLLERRLPGRAELHLLRAVKAAPDDVAAWRLLARAHQELGREPEVKADLEAILAVQPEDPDALFALGAAVLRDDDAGRARELFARLQRSAPDRADAAARVAGEWLDAGRADEALECARAAQAGGAGPDARLRLVEGLALKRLRRWPEAAQALRGVGEDGGDAFVSARVALSEVLAHAGRHAAASRALAGLLGARPGEVRLVWAQALVLERAGRGTAAASALRQAAELHERSGEHEDAAALWRAWAELSCRAGRAREALSTLEPAVAARPRSSQLRLALAGALQAAGSPDRAGAELRALLALEPDEPEALARLAALLVDQALPQDELEADRAARRAVELRPRSPEALAALGRVRSRRGDHAGAIAALERAVALSGREARFLDDLGEAYAAAGRPREAAAAWRGALASAADEVPPAPERMRGALQRKLRGAGRAVAEHGAPGSATPARP